MTIKFSTVKLGIMTKQKYCFIVIILFYRAMKNNFFMFKSQNHKIFGNNDL